VADVSALRDALGGDPLATRAANCIWFAMVREGAETESLQEVHRWLTAKSAAGYRFKREKNVGRRILERIGASFEAAGLDIPLAVAWSKPQATHCRMCGRPFGAAP